jgi:hypothetical protein
MYRKVRCAERRRKLIINKCDSHADSAALQCLAMCNVNLHPHDDEWCRCNVYDNCTQQK